MNLHEELIAPLRDILMINTVAVEDEAMGLVIVKIIVEDEAVVRLIATIDDREDAVKDRMVSSPMINEDEVLVTHAEDEVEMMKRT